MKIVLLILAVACFALGAWLGIFFMFIGGIQQIVFAAHHGWPAVDVAWGVAKIVFAAPVGWMVAAIGLLLIKVAA